MFRQEHGAKGIDFERFQGVFRRDLGGGFFRMEDTGEEEGEMEVGL